APTDLALAPGAQRLLSFLQSAPRSHQIATLTQRLGPWVPNAARALVHAGVAEEFVDEPVDRPVHRTTKVVRPAFGPTDIAERLDQLRRAPKQAALIRRVAEPSAAPYAAAPLRAEFGAPALAALVEKGFITITEEEELPQTRRLPVSYEPPLLPTGSQSAALARINAAQDDPAVTPRTFLLEGVTGSGKTEVYLQALAHCLASGKRAIVLVPELSLTPQTVQRFEARFPGEVALLHSGLSPGRHWDEWWAVHQGKRSIVVGPRSALFAPQKDLGLIILDEEHEWTYKQVDGSPRYHARDVARELARFTGAVAVLGSATPVLESAYAAERGTFAHLMLPSRIERSGAETRLPEVQVVDMRDELRAGNRSVFSRPLAAGLHEVMEAGEQAILFLNRRGSAGIVECRSCGHVMRCYRCGTPLTLHAGAEAAETLLCHHCNSRRRMPKTCPNCRSPHIRSLGVGTQKLVEDVRALLPNARVLRWDSDTASTVAAHTELLRSFQAREADILVGTQMIAKGLDMPSVTLVGVVLADLGLNLPDFRAPERTFQLLTQVAGRAGRGNERGNVIIQSYEPEHYAVQAAARQDYRGFYNREIELRRAHGNPPITRLVRLLFGHTQPNQARNEALRMASALRRAAREWDISNVDVVGPAPGYPPRVRGAWRWHLFVRGADPRLLLDKVDLPPGWAVDVDPVNVV
ncbi:MAG: primosomal protein N', partial [Chloroflexi bacterium]|nr:primosomal protein N' [Chloroflexota bacterium]